MNLIPQKPKIVVICGPTGIGKTQAAIEIAEVFGGEIIGADSMQIYRHMDIGTAKPTAAERTRVCHHLIDIVDPDAPFDAVRYAQLATDCILQLHHRGVTAFVVGGTGLYIKALLHGLFQSDPVDAEIRNRLIQQAAQNGSAALHDRLKRVDPDTAARLHPNDSYRIIRALETIEASGKSIAEFQREHGFADAPFHTLKIGLQIERQKLYRQIDRRVEIMIAAGFVDEVKKLLAMGYSADLKSMQSIGYRHIVDFIEGRLPWDECIRTLKRDHRRYAKRQLTWFGADDQIIWKAPDQTEQLIELVEAFLKQP